MCSFTHVKGFAVGVKGRLVLGPGGRGHGHQGHEADLKQCHQLKNTLDQIDTQLGIELLSTLLRAMTGLGFFFCLVDSELTPK